MSYKTIISANELAAIAGQDDVRIFDCRFSLKDPAGGLKCYREGHIPGAQHADMDTQLSSPVTQDSGRHPLPDPQVFAETLGRWGVSNDTQVIAYDDLGGAFAARLWWLLRWMGHQDVAVLDGGLQKWQEQGHAVTTEEPEVKAATFTPAPNDDLHVDIDFVSNALAADQITLFDGRSSDRFTGKDQQTDPVPGHVPGAISMPFAGNLDANGYFLGAEELHQRFAAKISGRDIEQVVNMCGSGVTACHNLLAMEIAGLPASRLFVGSWSQWIKSGDRPVATGPD